MTRAKKLGVALRRLLTFAAIVALLAFSRPTPTMVAIALPFLLTGEAIRVWSAGYLLKTQELITAGPYRHTRNPLYLGRLLILTGLALICPLPFHTHWAALAISLAGFFGYYLPRKERVEPERLERHHGDAYRRYRAAVPSLFPTPKRYPSSAHTWTRTRFLRNREHWMVAGVLGVIALQLVRALR